jgi:hypothetical protein
MTFVFKKENRKLVFKDYGGYETRNPSTIWCIQQADKIYNWNDFPEKQIFTTDSESNFFHYTYSKQNNYLNLVPDFNFHSWPQVGINDYEELYKSIDKKGRTPFNINKVGWIGNINTHPFRKKLLEIGNTNTDLMDIFDCGNWFKQSNSILLGNNKYISTPDLVSTYSILLDIEGNGYSGRLKHLLWSHRPVILVDRPHNEYFFEYLKEWEHYIPVNRDLTDLVEKIKWILENYDKALIIAENAYNFSKKYLTREACYKQWNYIITNHNKDCL